MLDLLSLLNLRILIIKLFILIVILLILFHHLLVLPLIILLLIKLIIFILIILLLLHLFVLAHLYHTLLLLCLRGPLRDLEVGVVDSGDRALRAVGYKGIWVVRLLF